MRDDNTVSSPLKHFPDSDFIVISHPHEDPDIMKLRSHYLLLEILTEHPVCVLKIEIDEIES